jgi:hypothetical protein
MNPARMKPTCRQGSLTKCEVIRAGASQRRHSFGEPRSVRVARDPASRSESILLVRNGVETELETSGLQVS